MIESPHTGMMVNVKNGGDVSATIAITNGVKHLNGFNSCVTAWNKGVRMIIGLPCTTHTWMLGPLKNSVHMKYKLYIRDSKFSDNIK